MGWTTTYRPKGKFSNRQWFEQEFPETLTGNGYIVAEATVGGVWYAAVQNYPGAKSFPGQCWAMIVLMQRYPASYHNFGWKEMDETEGPWQASAPAKVLDALSPTDSQYANEWRARCRENLAKQAAAAKVKPGDLVKFSRVLEFTSGAKADELEFVARSTFKLPSGYWCQVPGWRTRYSWEVVPA